MTTFFTSDTHFSHRNILVYEAASRPFADTDIMDERLIDIWNDTVGEDDTVWHLGDFSLSVRQALEIVPFLNGHIHLIAGNHDSCWTGNPSEKRARKAEHYVPQYEEAGFEEVVSSGSLHNFHVGHHTVLLTHLPTEGDHSETDRYQSVRPLLRANEVAAICGHVHSAWIHNGRNINVGVDVRNLAPVSESSLEAEIDELLEELKND